jgi:hypothetical protein
MSTVDTPLARKLGTYVALSEDELSVLQGFHKRRKTFDTGQDLVLQGQLGHAA